jgi:hypothetical protein
MIDAIFQKGVYLNLKKHLDANQGESVRQVTTTVMENHGDDNNVVGGNIGGGRNPDKADSRQEGASLAVALVAETPITREHLPWQKLWRGQLQLRKSLGTNISEVW